MCIKNFCYGTCVVAIHFIAKLKFVKTAGYNFKLVQKNVDSDFDTSFERDTNSDNG